MKTYTNLDSPACYSSIDRIYKEVKKKNKNITRQDVRDVLAGSRTYTIHKRLRKKLPRLKTVPVDFMTDLQADLADFQKVVLLNDGYNYCLVAIDVLSRRVWVAPLKSKSPKHVKLGFDKIFKEMPYIPQYLFTDKGTEFQAKEMKEYYKKMNINKHVAQSPDVKAALAERVIETLKHRLYKYFSENQTSRWIDVIEKIADDYNHSIHSVTKMRPIDVNYSNSEELWNRLYGDAFREPKKKPRYKVGDTVRISKEKRTFEKGYLPNYSHEIYRIDAVKGLKDPVNYRLIDDDTGEEIIGKFYDAELSRVVRKTKPKSSLVIEKVLDERLRGGIPEYYVKYKGLPLKNAQWVRLDEVN